jgi:hypothetical protein
MIFANLLGWQRYFNYQLSAYQNFLLVFSRRQKEIIFLPPLPSGGSLSACGPDLFSVIVELTNRSRQLGLNPLWRYFPDAYLNYLKDKPVKYFPERDNFDYIYQREELTRLSGQKFAAKRNLLKQFQRLYQYEYEPVGIKNLSEIYRFIRQWSRTRPVLNSELIQAENQLAISLSRNFSFLPLSGGLIRVAKKIVAVTLASLVQKFQYPDGIFPTAVIHIEKASILYPGAYQMINYLFCKNLDPEIVRINREEDLGLAGLRQAKLSYNPIFLLSKSRLLTT